MKEHPTLFNGEMVRAILDGRKTQTRRVVKGIPDNAILPRYYADDAPREALRHSLGWFVPEAGDAWPCNDDDRLRCPYGEPGDRLWVRERIYIDDAGNSGFGQAPYAWHVVYKADDHAEWCFSKTLIKNIGSKPSIHMPRWASRITLEVTAVRVERVQDISPSDAVEEGAFYGGRYKEEPPLPYPVATFKDLWDSINAKPKPVKVDGVIDHYVSFPWDGESGTFEHRGKPWIVTANPLVWVVEFKRICSTGDTK